MIKKLSIIVLISVSLCAQSFNEFLNNAIKNSPYLKSSILSISQAHEEGLTLQRYENPSLEVEYSRFKQNNSNNDNGYRVNYTQPLRLWGISSDKEIFANAIEKSAISNYTLNKAQFIRDISLLYTKYAEQKKYLSLRSEELEIAKHIYNISKTRSQAGTISKGVMLQAKVDYEMIEIKKQSLSLDIQEAYFKLLKFAGIQKEIELDFRHVFKLNLNSNLSKNPNILYFQSIQDEAKASSRVNSNKIEWIDLNLEYENEPDQSIIRVGASIPLALFNTKSEEIRIAKLEADKANFLIKNEDAKVNIEKIRLQKQEDLLLVLKSQNEQTLKTQTTLLNMFEDSYKIANINLLELQNIKNGVIKTKESLIIIDTKLNQNAILTNYTTGAYNE